MFSTLSKKQEVFVKMSANTFNLDKANFVVWQRVNSTKQQNFNIVQIVNKLQAN